MKHNYCRKEYFVSSLLYNLSIIKQYSYKMVTLYRDKMVQWYSDNVVTWYHSNLVKRQADRCAHAGRSHGPPLRPYASTWELELELRLNKVLT